MKIAHLILTHTHPGEIERLIKKLSHPGVDFYIHIDAKKNVAEFAAMQSAPNVHYIKKSVKIIPGTYGMVQATLNAFEQIIASGIQYDYINLLSGQDYPTKEPSFIHQYFALHRGKQFMEFHSIYNVWQEAIPHIARYHLINYNVPGKYRLERVVNKLMPARRMPKNMEPVGCSEWFSITLPAVKYIVGYLQDNPDVTHFFKLTWAPDKFIFQTILYNSTFRRDMINSNLRYMEGSEAQQESKTIAVHDMPAPVQSGCLFARKQSLHNGKEPADMIEAFIDYKVSA